jgi:hypothetical protein
VSADDREGARMSEKKQSTRARVQVNLEITTSDNWGGDCPLSQVYKQAQDSALGLLGRILKEHPNVRVLDVARIQAIVVEESR